MCLLPYCKYMASVLKLSLHSKLDMHVQPLKARKHSSKDCAISGGPTEHESFISTIPRDLIRKHRYYSRFDSLPILLAQLDVH